MPTLERDDACKGKRIPLVLAKDVIIDKFFVCNLFQSAIDGLDDNEFHLAARCTI